MGTIALTLGGGAMRTGCGVGDAVSTLRYGVAVVTIGDEGVSVSGRRVGGVSTGGGDGGRVSTGDRGSMRDQWEWRSMWQKSRKCCGSLATVRH